MRQNDQPKKMERRRFLSSFSTKLAAGLAGPCLSWMAGCSQNSARSALPDFVFGQRGFTDGRFQTPRAIAIDSNDFIYVADKAGRIQKFDTSGRFLLGWRTPEIERGKPTGLSIDSDGSVVVSDTHYYRFLFYTPEGELVEDRTIGGKFGTAPGEFAFVTDIVRAPWGEWFCGEYGEADRIHRYSAGGQYLDVLGEHGSEPLQFNRPQSLNIDSEGLLWVADSSNHRIQVIDWREKQAKSVAILGERGSAPGQLCFPHGLTLARDGTLIVSEYGNHRVQHLQPNGSPISAWGGPGRAPGQLNEPWATAIDSKDRVYVVDSKNNRVQRFRF